MAELPVEQDHGIGRIKTFVPLLSVGQIQPFQGGHRGIGGSNEALGLEGFPDLGVDPVDFTSGLRHHHGRGVLFREPDVPREGR